MLKKASLTLVGLALFAAACSGAHQSVSPLPPSIPQSADRNLSDATSALYANDDDLAGPLVAVTASVVVTVPTSASAAKSISIKVNTGTPIIANLSSTSPGCSGTNPVVCTLSVSATTGSDVFAFKTFKGSNGTGTVLATGSVLQTITTTSKTVHVILAGSPRSIALALKSTRPRECDPATTIPLYVMVKVSTGDIIIGSYGLTVTLADSDTSGKTMLSPSSISNSSSSVTLAYNGLPLKSATISASASGVSGVTNAVLSPSQMLYVTNFGVGIDVFPATATGNVTPTRQIVANPTTDSAYFASEGIALTPDCKLWVMNSSLNLLYQVPAHASGNVTATEISGSNTQLGSSPSGFSIIAVDATGKIYVPVPSVPQINIYAANASGNVAPVAVIGGSNTGLVTPYGVGFDSTGKIYVTDNSAGTAGAAAVLVYAARSTGNVAPIAKISGTNTGLNAPVGVATDSTGKIYVANWNNGTSPGTITVYAPGANGNVSPTQSINVNVSGGTPTGVALDYRNNLFTNVVFTGTVLSYGPGATGNATPRTNISGSNTNLVNVRYVAL